jgi:hypothetical protein
MKRKSDADLEPEGGFKRTVNVMENETIKLEGVDDDVEESPSSSTSSPKGPVSASPVPVSPPQQQQQIRISARVLRKREERLGYECDAEAMAAAAAAAIAAAAAAAAAAEEAATTEKPRRTWEQWSAEDKTIFFDALNECGKNFDSIQAHFQSKAAKNKRNLLKNKEQIRTFYYRTWHKIARYISFPEQLKKSSQELYGLINFGELRKKVGSNVDDKKGSKLQELIFSGHTTVRARGKTYRLRTPICRALKRLNSKLDASKSSGGTLSAGGGQTAVPSSLVLDLKPLKEEDFFHVHARCYQNPHVRIKVSPQQRLSRVIEFLDNKWAPAEHKLHICLKKNSVMLNSASAASPSADTFKATYSELWLMTRNGTKLTLPVVTSVEPVTSSTLSLSSLQAKMDRGKKKIVEESNNDGGGGGGSGTDANGKVEQSNVATTVAAVAEMRESGDANAKESSELQASGAKMIEPGWNKTKSDCLSMGELYLMLGSNEDRRIELCYAWLPMQSDLHLATKQEMEVDCMDKKNLEHSQLSASSSSALSSPSKAVDTRNSSLSVFPPVVNMISRLAYIELAKIQQHKVSAAAAAAAASSSPNRNAAALLSPSSSSSSTSSNTASSPKSFGSKQERPPPQTLSPSTKQESAATAEFRRPAVPPVRIGAPGGGGSSSGGMNLSAQSAAFKQQVIQMLPKFTNRRGRTPMSRKSVISRQMLANRPVQPKNLVNINGANMRLIQNGSGKLQAVTLNGVHRSVESVVAIHSATLPPPPPSIACEQAASVMALSPVAVMVHLDHEPLAPLMHAAIQPSLPRPPPADQSPPVGSSTPLQHRSLSPTGSLSSLFDGSLSEMGGGGSTNPPDTPTKCDHFLDSVLENSNSSVLQTPPRHRPTPPSSPSRAVSGGESWLLPDAMSLSSFLNLGESPSKSVVGGSSVGIGVGSSVSIHINEDSSHSTGSEVDRQLISMMTENSVDFTNKFAKLASHVNDGD